MYSSASYYDDNNPNLITNLVGENILRDDSEQDHLLTYFLFGMARYFDDIKSYIDQFENLRTTNYQNINETPDLFLPYLKKYFGWKVTEHFNEANPLEFYFGNSVAMSGNIELPLVDIRNQFWKRILNNLPYLYSTKGKKSNIESFFNVLGLNKENITLKEYGYLPGSTLSSDKITKNKVSSVLAITRNS